MHCSWESLALPYTCLIPCTSSHPHPHPHPRGLRRRTSTCPQVRVMRIGDPGVPPSVWDDVPCMSGAASLVALQPVAAGEVLGLYSGEVRQRAGGGRSGRGRGAAGAGGASGVWGVDSMGVRCSGVDVIANTCLLLAHWLLVPTYHPWRHYVGLGHITSLPRQSPPPPSPSSSPQLALKAEYHWLCESPLPAWDDPDPRHPCPYTCALHFAHEMGRWVGQGRGQWGSGWVVVGGR